MSAPNSTPHPEQADFVSDKKKLSRWQVIELLIEAAEVEHMLALQYIYAASSLKIRAEEFDNEKRKYYQAELVRGWKKTIHSIYREEMQHLHVVNQVLVGVGAEPYFGRPNFPVNWFYKEKGTDSGKIPMVLAQFDPDTLWRFLTFERGPIDQEMPELMPNFVAAYRDGKTSPLGEIPEPSFYKDLAQLYTDIMNGLTEKMFELGKKDVNDMFKETGDDAETPQLPGDRGIPKITDVATAKAALQQVIDQGEGIGATDVNGHFQKFKSIWDAFRAELVIDEHFRPARNVMANPQLRYHSEVVDGVFKKNSTPEQKQAASENPLDIRCIHKIPDGTVAHKFSNLLCEAYEFLVIWLRQIYTHKVTCEREFHAIRQLAFLPYMSEVILPLSEIITEIVVWPSAQSSGNIFLGASFEITNSAMSLPSAHALRSTQIERLRDMGDDAKQLVELCQKPENNNQLPKRALKRLEDLRLTFHHLSQEFDFRSRRISPPIPGDKLIPSVEQGLKRYSEDATNFDPEIDMGTYLKLDFEGWAHCRLATNPDSSNDPRGTAGNSFAFADEPDLDSVLRFQPTAGTVGRPGIPFKFGVTVKKATKCTPAGESNVPDVFQDAKVDLLGSPALQGLNHIVGDPAKEIVDPFELEVRDKYEKPLLKRRAIGKTFAEGTASERRWCARGPISVKSATNLNLFNIGQSELIGRADDYWVNRTEVLKQELSKIDDKLSAKAIALQARLDHIEKATRVMMLRLGLWERHRHTLSGDRGWASETAIPFKVLVDNDPNDDTPKINKWFVTYDLSFFDTDALSLYIQGNLYVPINPVQKAVKG